MANQFVDHKDRWLSLSDNDSDFVVLFIRAWIPFNAWYCNTYPQHQNKDRLILESLKTDANLFRTRIISLLSNNTQEASYFKHQLSELHRLLEANFIPNHESRVSFSHINFRQNPSLISPAMQYRNIKFKAERMSNGSVIALILNSRTNQTLYSYSNSKYLHEHFSQDLQGSNISIEIKVRLFECFNLLILNFQRIY